MGTFAIGVQVLLAAVFATAGAAKLLDRSGSQRALVGFGVPETPAAALAVALPLAEIAVAVALVLRPSARWGAVAALVLLLSFVAGISRALRQGTAPDCHCFGQIHSAPAVAARWSATVCLPRWRSCSWSTARAQRSTLGSGPAAPPSSSPSEQTISAAVLATVSWRLWTERGELRRDLSRLATRDCGVPARRASWHAGPRV